MESYLDKGVALLVNYAPKFVAAILVLLIGFYVIKIIVKAADKMMKKREVDESLRPFFGSMIAILLKLGLIISVMGMVGIEMTSFIAILGAAGLAVGMALSGTLSNFAGGVMLLIFKPFRVGHYIEAQGYAGVVKEIQLFNTILNTVDNRVVILPNGALASGAMVNFSEEDTRRVDFTFGIGYSDDIDKAKAVLQKIIDADKRVLTSPEAFIAVSELADSSVNFTVRLWVKSEDYWGVFFHMNETVKKTFDNENISIPFPQRDVHVFNEK